MWLIRERLILHLWNQHYELYQWMYEAKFEKKRKHKKKKYMPRCALCNKGFEGKFGIVNEIDRKNNEFEFKTGNKHYCGKCYDLEKEGSTKPIFNFISVSMNSFSCFQSVSFVSFLKTGFVHRYFWIFKFFFCLFQYEELPTTQNIVIENATPTPIPPYKRCRKENRCDFPL